ncbi:hypothetical protein CJ030_MR7G022903 [Morella rubra]|uniref:Uncharacterized protein n=1 Tax=Morella rubra TaxID=262757 RepID=A0A6A1V4J6_9ROSI|nr:hypothetical protein CJ030_MR7G022903 [Morella rubra]
MGRNSYAWEDRCRDEAPVAPMGTLDTSTSVRREHHSHAMASARVQACPKHQRPCLACQPACHRYAMTAHSPWPCHDTVPQQVLGHQPSQAGAAGQQTKECHDIGWPPPPATTSGGAPPPLPVLGGEWKRKVLEAEGAPPPMEVQAAAAPPWTAASDYEIQTLRKVS